MSSASPAPHSCPGCGQGTRSTPRFPAPANPFRSPWPTGLAFPEFQLHHHMLDLSLLKHTLPLAAVSRLQTDFVLLKELRFVLFSGFFVWFSLCLSVVLLLVVCFCFVLSLIEYSWGSVKITSS